MIYHFHKNIAPLNVLFIKMQKRQPAVSAIMYSASYDVKCLILPFLGKWRLMAAEDVFI